MARCEREEASESPTPSGRPHHETEDHHICDCFGTPSMADKVDIDTIERVLHPDARQIPRPHGCNINYTFCFHCGVAILFLSNDRSGRKTSTFVSLR